MTHIFTIQAVKQLDDVSLMLIAMDPMNIRPKHYQDGSLPQAGVHLSAQAAVAGATAADQELGHNNNEKPGLRAYVNCLATALAPPPMWQDVEDEWVKVEHGPSGHSSIIAREISAGPWSVFNIKTK